MASKLKKEKKVENVGKDTMELFLQYTVVILMVLIVTILPLTLKNGYYQIGDHKFKVYGYLMAGGIILMTPMLLLYAFFSRKEFSLKKLWQGLSVTDKFVIAYFLFTLISFFANPKYMKDNLLGYSGWYMGLYAQFTFVFLYFVVSRFAKDYKIIIVFLAGTSFLTYVFAILHRLLIDPLHTYDGLDPQYYTFLSTLGQSSWYSSFLCTFMPFMMGLYMVAKNRKLQIASGFFCITAFVSLVSQNTDSAYLAALGAFLVLLSIAADEDIRMKRLTELAAIFFLSGKIMWALLRIHPNEYLLKAGSTTELDRISKFMIFDSKSWFLVLLIFFFWLALFLLKDRYPQRAMRFIKYLVYSLVILGVIFVGVTLYLDRWGKLPESIANIVLENSYLDWNYGWGNGRGFTWGVTWKMLSEFGFTKFMLGVGPDGYSRYGYEFYQDIIRLKWGDSVLTNAHNEWMNMLVNGGLLGAVSYIGIFISALVRSIKYSREKEKWLIGVGACVLAYMFHNAFCYQEVLCTPFVFLIIAIGELVNRKLKD